MNLNDDTTDGRRKKGDPERASEQEAVTSKSEKRKKKQAGDVGNALRSAYRVVVDEEIPPEMLDLLGKLG